MTGLNVRQIKLNTSKLLGVRERIKRGEMQKDVFKKPAYAS